MLIPHFQHWMTSKTINSVDKILLAVSGGLDSMVMLDLFFKAKLQIEVVHVNYQLRGNDSDLDQEMVENICAKHTIQCHIKRANKPANCNTQEWARDERYSFMAELMDIHQYQFIATAHHQQDQLETVLMSVFKGYSIQTIKPERALIIRPLLESSKEDILKYASANMLEYRNDKSNFSSDYDRNFIRNEVIPTLRDRFDNFDKRVVRFAERQTNKNELLDKLINKSVEAFSITKYNNLKTYSYQEIDLNILQEKDGKDILVNYLVNHYSFHVNQIKDLFLSDTPNAAILNKNFICTKDELILYVGAQVDQKNKEIGIDKNGLSIQTGNLKLTLSTDDIHQHSKDFLKVDYDQVQFPLILRTATEKDKFHAFGLKGKTTSLTKFLKDRGIPSIRRTQEYILIDASNRIIVPGMEIDYGLKITNSSKTALIIDLQDKTT